MLVSVAHDVGIKYFDVAKYMNCRHLILAPYYLLFTATNYYYCHYYENNYFRLLYVTMMRLGWAIVNCARIK
jgi:hypothetical protein